MEDKQKERRDDNLANRRLLRRTLILMAICGVLIFIPVLAKLWNLQITRHDELEQMAVTQQTSTQAITAPRGTIYDTNGNVLAISATAYDVIISPKAIADLQTELDEKKTTAQEKNDPKNPASQYDKDVEELVVKGMADILGLDEADLREKCADSKSQYKRLAQKVDADVEKQIRTYIDDNGLTGCIYLQNNTKRYYPYSTLASQIVGFANDNGGAYGLEATFDDDLSGKNGLVVTAKNAKGTDLLNFFQDYYDAESGSSLRLTLDSSIQSMCEDALKSAIEKNDVQDGGVAIAMSCKTGAILGMASLPNYDLNNYGTVIDETLLANLESSAQEYLAENPEKTQEEAQQWAYSNAVNIMWRNKAVNDTYEPGSTFKTVVLASALEEKSVTLDDTFNCTGSVMVADWPKPIYCSNRSGHGYQTLAEAVGHSCNPAFIAMGQRLGADAFWDYMQKFGIVGADGAGTGTGIDLPGESKSIFWSRDSFNIVNLATASFGQRFQVTPIQLITAANAVINGGYYYQPYVVDSVTAADGTVTYSADTAPLRQVVSSSTSETCRELLEGVVSGNMTGKNAYRAGYRIGGKTGTSQTLKDLDGDGTNEYILSFLGFAPADDPEVVVLVVLDSPKNAGGMMTPSGEYISGGNMATPVAADLLVNILDYMNYGRQYTADEISTADAMVPYLDQYNLKNARAVAKEKGFTVRVVGSEDDDAEVNAQVPSGKSYIPSGSEVVLYTGDNTPPDSITMPDLTGMTPTQVQDALSEVGLYMKATGASKYYGSATKAYQQSVAADTEVAPGTVVTVSFNDTSDTDNDADVIG
ncbi:MAG: penicillin-binding transpeptidase domain-containing protein [Oscillospiraceae bacterium]|nr:penicillin-binding transpeptidase domain-containing protein [Eubacteriales bacterium]MDY2617453.1 penicillin-binding transpeptidase domain-containing protein [Oscillospiraceae bacterium]